MLKKTLILLAVIVPLTLAACGGDDDDDASTAAETTSSETSSTTTAQAASGGGGETVAIKETEYKLDPSDPTVKAGTVTFDLSNDGTTDHNLEIEGDGVEEVSDTIAAGQSGELTVDLEPGTYEIYCAIDGHKDLGMEGELTVQ